MRTAGICSIHQSLSQEAITIVKQAITLARRRGHAQVTPIHVATVMLASPSGLLRSACLKSSINSHPYQCKALELCFNVALNRLPGSTTSSPLLGLHSRYPALANALMAAFKRAQAHQRRGSVEAQQQPILGLKIECEQLVVSILDDPSVSRVMREAGFSSTLLKSYVQQSLTHLDLTTTTTTNNNNNYIPTASLPLIISQEGHVKSSQDDVSSSVIDTWMRKMEKSSTVVIVGECLGSCESVVRAVKERLERGDINNNNIPVELRYVKFLNCPLVSMKNHSRDEIDTKLGEIRRLVNGCVGRGVVLYLGDLKWVAEYWAYYNKNGDQQNNYQHFNYNYCLEEHLVMGLRRLVFGNTEINNNGRIWLLGISNFKSLLKCKVGNPSLETLLDLHPLTIPSPSLDLSLNLQSKKNTSTSTSSRLPSWLQKCKEEEIISREEKAVNLTMSCSPTSSHSISSYEEDYSKPKTTNIWLPMSWTSTKLEEHQFLSPQKPELLSNPNSIPNSASSSQATEPLQYDRFKDNTPESLEELCSELEKKVPCHKDIIREIATTVLRCRSRKFKQVTWLLFLGEDGEIKLKLAKELGNLVFGVKTTNFFSIKDDYSSKKRKRGEEVESGGVTDRLGHAVRENPHRVFYVEDLNEEESLKGLKRAIETGVFVLSGGERVPLEDAIVIFSSACSQAPPPVRQKLEQQHLVLTQSLDSKQEDDEACSSLSLDLNIAVDYDGDDNESVGEFRILNAVDKHIVFRKIQAL